MTAYSSLVPRNATPMERAFSLASADQPRLPAELLGALYDPMACPERLLPYLAWAFSVDIWKEEWSTEKKRAVIAASPALHRLKGTKPGLEKHLDIVGASLVRLRQPPAKFIPDPALTKEEREAYLARFRQIRVYPFRSRGTATFQAYANSGGRLPRLFAGAGFWPAKTDAIGRIGRRAYLYEPRTGAETPIVRVVRETIGETREAIAFEQFRLPGKSGFGMFASEGARRRQFAIDTGARSRIHAMTIRSAYDSRSDVLHLVGSLPSDQPIDVRPRKVAQPGQRRLGQLFTRLCGDPASFIGRAADGRYRLFLPYGTAGERIFDQVYLHDPERLPDKRHARTFAGASFLGLPPHHLIATVRLRGGRSRFAFGRFAWGFVVASRKDAVTDAIMATAVSKAAAEKVLLRTRTMRPATAGDRLALGSVTVGEWIKDF